MSSNRWEHHFAKRRRMAAFTLLELVLVLAILAILALVAVRSLTGVGDQTRFDATRIQLGNINAAVLGTPSAASTDVSNPIFSFVNDNGRLPVAVGNDPASQLRELWTNPNDLPLLAPRQATSYDLDVWIICGWRGSYLQLGIGQTTILDGWGNPYDYLHNDGLTPCVDADPIEIIRSRGAGGQLDTPATTGFNAYQYLAFNSTVPLGSMPPANRYAATLTGNVYFYNSNTGQMENPSLANGDVIVALFGQGGPISAN
jgi:prepilin-type N-terminal cleavage/methylation domain-containing protein